MDLLPYLDLICTGDQCAANTKWDSRRKSGSVILKGMRAIRSAQLGPVVTCGWHMYLAEVLALPRNRSTRIEQLSDCTSTSLAFGYKDRLRRSWHIQAAPIEILD